MNVSRQGALLLVLFNILLAGLASAGSEGGNITSSNIVANTSTIKWGAAVGLMNGSVSPDTGLPIANLNLSIPMVYAVSPNGTFTNLSLVITRSGIKPPLSNISSPNASDFTETGLFANFTSFLGMTYSSFTDNPQVTFCNPCKYTNCTLGASTFQCAYTTLNDGTVVGVLKFMNGGVAEPIFVTLINNRVGFNGSIFDFESLLPARENYFFYVYQKECNITVYVDGVQTTVFPNTGVPYAVRVVVSDPDGVVIPNADLRAVEENGRSLASPSLAPGRVMAGVSQMITNSSGESVFALAPTRYNIPDSYGYMPYFEVVSPFVCRVNLSIAQYSALVPTYRSSLVNDSYASQVKSSVQNMNALASNTGRWVTARKMRYVNTTVNVLSGGNTGVPTMKAGALNMLNISATDGSPVTAEIRFNESEGQIIYAPLQPDKAMYSTNATFYTNETFLVIPTGYNNNANITLGIWYNGSQVGTVSFPVDAVLASPGAGETDMDDGTYALISSALQNINSVLSNFGKSISTV